MIFNYHQKNLKFIINGTDYGYSHQDINNHLKYRMGISVFNNVTTIQLVSYQYK